MNLYVKIFGSYDGKQSLDSAKRDVQELDNATEKASKGGLASIGKALGDMGKIAGGVAIANAVSQLPGFLMSAANAAAADEQETARLNQALENLRVATGGSAEDLARWTGEVNGAIEGGQKLAFTDSEVRDSYQSLLAATGDSAEAIERQAAAMDLARGANIPLATATKMLGKLNEENIEVFKKLGITIGEGATEAEALALVQEKFGGQAKAYAESSAGQFQVAKIQMGELTEQIGAQLLPVMAALGSFLVEKVVPAIQSFVEFAGPHVKAAFTEISTAAQAFAQTAGPYIQRFSDEAKVQFAKFQQYWNTDLKPAFDNIVAATKYVADKFKEHWGEIEPVLQHLFEIVKLVFDNIRLAIGIVIDLIGGDFSGAWDKYKQMWANGLKALEELVLLLWDFFKLQVSVLRDIWGDILTGALDGAQSVWNDSVRPWFAALPGDMLDALGNLDNLLVDIGRSIAAGLLQGLKDGFNAVKDEVSGWADAIKARKGPLEADRKLLIEEGLAITEGLSKGLGEGFDDIKRQVALWVDNIKIATQPELYLSGIKANVDRYLDAAAKGDIISSYVGGGQSATLPTTDVAIGTYVPGIGYKTAQGYEQTQGAQASIDAAYASGQYQQGFIGGTPPSTTVNVNISAIDGASVKAVIPEIAKELVKHQQVTGIAFNAA